MLSQIGCLASDLQHERLYANACRQMMTESLSLATNTTYGLMLLHLPPPHRPGIYLPDKDQFSLLSQPAVPGYFNNLVFADRWLGKLRRALEDSGLWSQTWLLLSADHSWRASSLYDHRRDLRVPFLLKTGGEPASMTYSSRFNTVLTRDLILAILRGQVGSQQDISAWLDAHRSEHMPVISGPSTAD
jgi:arylsulfatase A-like enzyme